MKLLFALLTTLFVSVMPLSTAYGSPLNETIGVCQVEDKKGIDALMPEENFKQLAEQGGTARAFKDKEAFRVLAEAADITGLTPPSVPFNSVVIVFPAPKDEVIFANLAVFQDGCFVQFGRLPAGAVYEAIERMEGTKS